MDWDLVTAVTLAGAALTDRALQRVRAAGHPYLRTSHGYLVQHVVDGPRSIGEIAVRMGVTQQAASKAVGELVDLGYLSREPDPSDARTRRIALSTRGRDAVETTRRVRAELEAELGETLGADRVRALRSTANQALEWVGADAARERRVRPPQ
ncbi:MarR family winged helix-turn-helix transcriptional regulator [Pseudonocardia sp. ICBG162]|uniref:MarR family winged helix-turn-helix transcriptional regulator n=1 Tax=Pseudonocardia sp. ICBG162 TaxID=2846761 RepID=UPI001CF691C2|nr:MarR family transcriptional regulator [Pseudonocardia sp. ICBG162]